MASSSVTEETQYLYLHLLNVSVAKDEVHGEGTKAG